MQGIGCRVTDRELEQALFVQDEKKMSLNLMIHGGMVVLNRKPPRNIDQQMAA